MRRAFSSDSRVEQARFLVSFGRFYGRPLDKGIEQLSVLSRRAQITRYAFIFRCFYRFAATSTWANAAQPGATLPAGMATSLKGLGFKVMRQHWNPLVLPPWIAKK